jgi:long-chain fatty acid transport protein
MKTSTAAALLFAMSAFYSNMLYANNGDQMLGVNAMQWGMGGAVVAAPQEAGTVFTNPAGLTHINMDQYRVDAGVGLINPNGHVNGVTSNSDFFAVPAGALAYRINNKLSLGIGVGGMAGTGVDFPDAFPATPGAQAFLTKKKLLKIAPALAYSVTPQFSIGFALNIDRQGLTLRNPTFQLPMEEVFGYGAALGVLYKLPNHLQLGVAYTTRQHMNTLKWNTPVGAYSANIDAPATFSTGIAWTPSDDMLVEFDIKKIWFSDVFRQAVFHTPGGTTIMKFDWDDQTVFALGLQKKVSHTLTLRAGVNYGKSPIRPEDVDTNIGSMAIAEKHLSAGLTYNINKQLAASVAYTRAFNNKLISTTASGTILEMQQNFLHLQLTYQH